MAMPALGFLAQELGRENLALLALKTSIRDMAEGTGFFGEIFCWDPDRQGLARGWSVLRAIRRAGFRHSLSLFPSSHWKFTLFAGLTGIPHKMGFRYPHQRLPARVQTVSLDLDPKAHDVDQNLRLAGTFLGRAHAGPVRLSFPLPPAGNPADTPPGAGYYVCHPGSSPERGMREKRLPAPAFAELIRRLHGEFGLKALLVGGPEEEALRREIAALAPQAAVDAAAGDLRRLAGQIQGARFFLGNDSGLMHVSAALGKPCLAFFGPTDERRTGPYRYWESENGRPRHLVLRREGLACAPCWTLQTVGRNPACIYGDTRCLRDFGVEEAWPRIRGFVAALPAPG